MTYLSLKDHHLAQRQACEKSSICFAEFCWEESKLKWFQIHPGFPFQWSVEGRGDFVINLHHLICGISPRIMKIIQEATFRDQSSEVSRECSMSRSQGAAWADFQHKAYSKQSKDLASNVTRKPRVVSIIKSALIFIGPFTLQNVYPVCSLCNSSSSSQSVQFSSVQSLSHVRLSVTP